MIRVIFTLSLIVLVSTSSYADEKAIYGESFSSEAEQGNIAAQKIVCYNNARWDRGPASTFKWCQKLAKEGDVRAQRRLGYIYLNGLNTPRDANKAAKWLRKAADQGDAQAQYYLASLYQSGNSVPQDWKQCAEWLRKAADQGLADAQFTLGKRYEFGQGVTKSLEDAYFWISLSASHNPPDSHYVYFRKEESKNLSPEQLSSVEKRVKEWLDEHPLKQPAQ